MYLSQTLTLREGLGQIHVPITQFRCVRSYNEYVYRIVYIDRREYNRPDPHSNPVIGRNAPKICFPTAMKELKQKRKKTLWGIQMEDNGAVPYDSGSQTFPAGPHHFKKKNK